LNAAVVRYEAALPLVSSYLDSRGISVAVAREFRLGGVSEPAPGHEAGKGRLSIPYLTPAGPVAVKFRCIADHRCAELGHGKYTAPRGQQVKLYNVAAFTADLDRDYIGIAEGELDALVLTWYCRIPAVGVPGASNWQGNPHWPRLFSGFSRVLVFRDPDTAGGELAARICDSLPQATVIELPADVNDTLLDKGPEFIQCMAGVT